MTFKEIVAKYWEDFEILSMNVIKCTLPAHLIIEERKTSGTKDGGYDGEFILSTGNNSYFRILFESKLRTNFHADLPLKEFAKSLIIAVVRKADMIYIVTNCHFSKDTIMKLSDFEEKTKLLIKLFDGLFVKHFIEENSHLLSGVNNELISFLSSELIKSKEQIALTNVNNMKHVKLSSNYFREKLQKRIISVITGELGCGKSYYIEKQCEQMKKEGGNVNLIDVSKCITYNELFIEILNKTIGLPFNLVDLIDEEEFEMAFSKIGENYTSPETIDILKFVFSKSFEFPYDYSMLFPNLVEVYLKLRRDKSLNITIAFLNLAYSQKEVLQLLLYFLKNDSTFSAILEIPCDDFLSSSFEGWSSVKQVFLNLATIQPYIVKGWTSSDAKRYLKEHICNWIVNPKLYKN